MTDNEKSNIQDALINPFSGPKVILAARIAANPAGRISDWRGDGASLHFTILLEKYRGYSIYGFDGQPNTIFVAPKNRFIQSGFYKNTKPSNIIHTQILTPPPSMTPQEFADALANGAHNFFSSTENYSFPEKIAGRRMIDGEYNSSSFIAGLLRSVYGYVPMIIKPSGYQTPGWENPLPLHYFRSGPGGAPR